MFDGRDLCIATMHQKETVIAPVLEQALGVRCFTCSELNTDLMGTFTGEIERSGTPVEAARQKCIRAMALTGCDLAVSSEGSFGSHPVVGFIPCDEEILFFCDRKHHIEIVVRELSTKTNFAGDDVQDFEALKQFALRAQFPSHGLILKDPSGRVIAKGIADWDKLSEKFNQALCIGVPVKVETDMRAHFNPTRMRVIEACAHKLVTAIKSSCPACGMPGFVVTDAEPGLPCELCHLPTRSSLKHIRTCKNCGHWNEILYPHQKQFEDPMYCDFCNP